LIDYMSVMENVELPLLLMRRSKRERKELVERALVAVDLDPRTVESLLPSQLSGGMKRRVSIARALVAGSEWLLFDEPTAGLDPLTARKLIETLQKLREKEGKSFIFSTHDPYLAREMGELFCFIENGVVSGLIERKELNAHPTGLKISTFLNREEEGK